MLQPARDARPLPGASRGPWRASCSPDAAQAAWRLGSPPVHTRTGFLRIPSSCRWGLTTSVEPTSQRWPRSQGWRELACPRAVQPPRPGSGAFVGAPALASSCQGPWQAGGGWRGLKRVSAAPSLVYVHHICPEQPLTCRHTVALGWPLALVSSGSMDLHHSLWEASWWVRIACRCACCRPHTGLGLCGQRAPASVWLWEAGDWCLPGEVGGGACVPVCELWELEAAELQAL